MSLQNSSSGFQKTKVMLADGIRKGGREIQLNTLSAFSTKTGARSKLDKGWVVLGKRLGIRHMFRNVTTLFSNNASIGFKIKANLKHPVVPGRMGKRWIIKRIREIDFFLEGERRVMAKQFFKKMEYPFRVIEKSSLRIEQEDYRMSMNNMRSDESSIYGHITSLYHRINADHWGRDKVFNTSLDCVLADSVTGIVVGDALPPL
ncbi:hypothetical protein Tco_1275200 [Tanacetum coccineum]